MRKPLIILKDHPGTAPRRRRSLSVRIIMISSPKSESVYVTAARWLEIYENFPGKWGHFCLSMGSPCSEVPLGWGSRRQPECAGYSRRGGAERHFLHFTWRGSSQWNINWMSNGTRTWRHSSTP